MLKTVAIAILMLGTAGCAEDQAGDTRLEQYPNRRFAATAWDTLGWIGPVDANDTTLVDPNFPTGWGDRLVVAEQMLSQVRAFSLDGKPLWTYGRPGAGPGEMQLIGGLAVTPGGNLWIFDQRNAKILEIGSDGTLIRELRHHHFPAVPTSVFFSGGNAIFGTPVPSQGYIFTRGDSLDVVRVAPSPWADSVDARFMVWGVTASDPEGGVIVQGLYHGPGFTILRAGDTEPQGFPYIDHVPWTLKASPALTAARADSARYGAVSADIQDGEIYFLFGGRPLRAAHPDEPTVLVDVYGPDGAYRRSYLLPFDSEGLAVIGRDRFAVLALEDELFPRIYFLRPRE